MRVPVRDANHLQEIAIQTAKAELAALAREGVEAVKIRAVAKWGHTWTVVNHMEEGNR